MWLSLRNLVLKRKKAFWEKEKVLFNSIFSFHKMFSKGFFSGASKVEREGDGERQSQKEKRRAKRKRRREEEKRGREMRSYEVRVFR